MGTDCDRELTRVGQQLLMYLDQWGVWLNQRWTWIADRADGGAGAVTTFGERAHDILGTQHIGHLPLFTTTAASVCRSSICADAS